MAEFIKAAATAEVPANTIKVVNVNGKEIALFNVDGTFYALDNTCAHAGGPLGEGELEGTVVTCPWHAWDFDVTNGKSLVGVGDSVPCHACRVEGDAVMVEA